jgi:hypothetical protein
VYGHPEAEVFEKGFSLAAPEKGWPQASIMYARTSENTSGRTTPMFDSVPPCNMKENREMGRESMTDLRNAREIYEIDVRSGAYGERRWVIMPIATLVLVLLASTGLFLRNRISGNLYLLAIFAASALLLGIPVLVGKMRRK